MNSYQSMCLCWHSTNTAILGKLSSMHGVLVIPVNINGGSVGSSQEHLHLIKSLLLLAPGSYTVGAQDDNVV